MVFFNCFDKYSKLVRTSWSGSRCCSTHSVQDSIENFDVNIDIEPLHVNTHKQLAASTIGMSLVKLLTNLWPQFNRNINAHTPQQYFMDDCKLVATNPLGRSLSYVHACGHPKRSSCTTRDNIWFRLVICRDTATSTGPRLMCSAWKTATLVSISLPSLAA